MAKEVENSLPLEDKDGNIWLSGYYPKDKLLNNFEKFAGKRKSVDGSQDFYYMIQAMAADYMLSEMSEEERKELETNGQPIESQGFENACRYGLVEGIKIACKAFSNKIVTKGVRWPRWKVLELLNSGQYELVLKRNGKKKK